MALPNKARVLSLDFGWFGQGFADVMATPSAPENTDDYAYFGVGLYPAYTGGSGGVGGAGGAQNIIMIIISM